MNSHKRFLILPKNPEAAQAVFQRYADALIKAEAESNDESEAEAPEIGSERNDEAR